MLGYNFSIVVQGPIGPGKFVFLSLFYRLFMPLSQIIFSHYSVSIHNGIFAKFIVISVLNNIDQTSEYFEINSCRSGSVKNNIKYQIQTSNSGIRVASRRFVIKQRSDCFLISLLPLIHIQKKFPNRIIAINYSIAPIHIFRNSPHVSDWFFVGEKEKILKFFRGSYPIKFLNCGQHYNPMVKSHYEERGYTDFLQAEEFLLYNFYNAKKANKFSVESFFNSNVIDAIRKDFVIAFGPAIGLIHIGKKINFWVPHLDRLDLHSISSLRISTFGNDLERFMGRIHKVFKIAKFYR